MGAPAEMARVALPVALAAEGRALATGPPLEREAILAEAKVAEPKNQRREQKSFWPVSKNILCKNL